jgi:hypothetical protein
MITETEIIIAYGSPEAKLKIGIQYQGLLSVFIFNALWLVFISVVVLIKVGWLSFQKNQ